MVGKEVKVIFTPEGNEVEALVIRDYGFQVQVEVAGGYRSIIDKNKISAVKHEGAWFKNLDYGMKYSSRCPIVTNMKFEKGQRIYNRGDMANPPGLFEITDIIADRFCIGYTLKELGGGREIKRLPEHCISEVDAGNGSTRFVTEKAHKEWREKQLQMLRRTDK